MLEEFLQMVRPPIDDKPAPELTKAAAWVLSQDEEAMASIVRELILARVISTNVLRTALLTLARGEG